MTTKTTATGNDTLPDPGHAVAGYGAQAAASEVRTQTDPRAAGAASPRGAQPSRWRCGYCFKPIMLMRNGEWYHVRKSSTSCKPGEGSDRRAFPAAERAR
jgi:hypothetical protein